MIDPVHPEVSDPVFRVDSWEWREPSHGEHFRTCSFCGCINPDDLAAEPTWHANWADRKYGWPHKFYVNIPNRNPDGLFALSASDSYKRTTSDLEWYHVDEMPDELREIVQRDRWRGDYRYFGFGKRPLHHAKFYSIHHNDPAISNETKWKIFAVSGMRFRFEDTDNGRVVSIYTAE